MVPTKRFWGMVALGIPIGAIAYQAGQPVLLLVYNLALLAVAWISLKLGPNPAQLTIRRKFDPVLSVRAANKIDLILENQGLEPISGRLRDEPPAGCTATNLEFGFSVPAERETELGYFLTPLERGSDFFRGTYVRLRCPLGLVERQVKLPTEQPVRIYPNVLALKEFELLKQQGRLREMGIRRSRQRGLGMEFESLRDYAEGDDYRKIDWKATARRSKLIVRQFEQERNQAVIIVIDIGRGMLSEVNGVRKLDHALDSCLMLTHAAAMAGDFVGLLVYSDVVKRYIPPRKGRNQIGIIIEALHDLVAEPVESDPRAAFSYLSARWKRRALLVTFTDCEHQEKAVELTTALGPLVRRHLTLVARVSDPKIKEAERASLEKIEGMYQRAAAAFLVKDRVDAGLVLSVANIHSLEAEPQDLASALVNFYFMVKEKSIL
ncbi:MAG: DUF58 domain-containing protein [Armatimonadetes bacterium]|nr:DUF58 domain-containing protein [Armatimonadota bacterium]